MGLALNLQKNIDFTVEEVKTLKEENSHLQEKVEQHEKTIASLVNKTNEAERYSRRWCLRLLGMVEGSEKTNIKEKMKEICRKILPEDEGNTTVRDIDVVHRIGRKLEDGRQLPCPVVMRFTSRTARDLIWKC